MEEKSSLKEILNRMLTIKINGIKTEAKEGSTILDVARQKMIYIPTLCHHEAMKPYGGCRLCAVEIGEDGNSRIVSSCQYIVEEGLVVRTDTERVKRVRELVLGLLLIDASENSKLLELAERLGIKKMSRFKSKNEPCILCGLCIRACREVVGVSAIDYVKRGYEKVVASPFFKKSKDCIGCGTCFYVCPTGAVKMHEIEAGEKGKIPDGEEIKGPARIFDNWKVGFDFKKCKECGENFIPFKQIEFIKEKVKVQEDFFDTCLGCKKEEVKKTKS